MTHFRRFGSYPNNKTKQSFKESNLYIRLSKTNVRRNILYFLGENNMNKGCHILEPSDMM